MTTQQPDGRPHALITGASSGLGAAFAERLAHEGYDLILVARRQERLVGLAATLGQQTGTTAEVLVADLTKPDQLRRVEQRAARDPTLTLLVNNAGFAGYMPFLQLGPDRAEEQIQLHVTALVRLTRAALPGMVARGRGAVINVSSALAFSAGLPPTPLPFRATYAASKAYVNVFTEQLYHELAGTGVQVQALCPGRVATEFFTVAGIDVARLPGRLMPPSEVVQASLVALARGEVVCVPPLAEAALVAQSRDSQSAVFRGVQSGVLAARYAAAPAGESR